jgi:hypothetical protein
MDQLPAAYAVLDSAADFWQLATIWYYRLELAFRVWKCDLDNASGPGMLKVFGEIILDSKRLN